MSGATAPEAETIIRQTETINRLMGDSASRIERVQRQLDSAYAAQQRYEQAQTAITAAVERGRITQERANQLLRRCCRSTASPPRTLQHRYPPLHIQE